ncbi:phage portal protein [Sphingomonas nostoxanthinifaciens]|uniref:phage portal protein n=1 Tax=Sphingomonas nostoxanthinifaciens TaxID=2872652 RepID=UPI001CC1C2AF|nr:phage portal protein [Sphingomonas nostoxanthinifaciens]UAK26521.1 phage portal protein [Sphingomonas nostoxanthinifaciens]
MTKLARAHFDSTACDAAGRHNFCGLQLQAARTIVISGAVLARRRWRRASDGLPVPFQLQILEPDYINMQFSAPRRQHGQCPVAQTSLEPRGAAVSLLVCATKSKTCPN